MIVYALSNPSTGEVRYIGKTERTLRQRLGEHRYNAKRVRTHLYCWWRSLSAEPLIEVVQNDAHVDGEQFWISQFRALGFRLVNHSDGGEGQVGLKHSPETRAKISRAGLGKKKPGVAAAMRGDRRNLGRVQTEADRIKKSLAQGGRPIQDQHGRFYSTTQGACRELGLDQAKVVAVLKGRAKTTRGYVFKYVDTAPNLSVQER